MCLLSLADAIHPEVTPWILLGLDPGSKPLEYSCLENFMDRGTWQAIVQWVAKSLTRLSNSHLHFHFTLPFKNFHGSAESSELVFGGYESAFSPGYPR